MRLGEGELGTTFGEPHVGADVFVVVLNAGDHVSVRVYERPPFDIPRVDVEGAAPHEWIVEERMNFVVNLPSVRLVHMELEVESLISVITSASDRDLLLEHVAYAIEVSRATEAKLAVIAGVSLLKRARIQVVEGRLRNRIPTEVDDALVCVGLPIGLRRHIRLTVVEGSTVGHCAQFPLLEEP